MDVVINDEQQLPLQQQPPPPQPQHVAATDEAAAEQPPQQQPAQLPPPRAPAAPPDDPRIAALLQQLAVERTARAEAEAALDDLGFGGAVGGHDDAATPLAGAPLLPTSPHRPSDLHIFDLDALAANCLVYDFRDTAAQQQLQRGESAGLQAALLEFKVAKSLAWHLQSSAVFLQQLHDALSRRADAAALLNAHVLNEPLRASLDRLLTSAVANARFADKRANLLEFRAVQTSPSAPYHHQVQLQQARWQREFFAQLVSADEDIDASVKDFEASQQKALQHVMAKQLAQQMAAASQPQSSRRPAGRSAGSFASSSSSTTTSNNRRSPMMMPPAATHVARGGSGGGGRNGSSGGRGGGRGGRRGAAFSGLSFASAGQDAPVDG